MAPTPIFLPEKFYGQRSLEGYNPWTHKESDITEHTHAHRGHGSLQWLSQGLGFPRLTGPRFGQDEMSLSLVEQN